MEEGYSALGSSTAASVLDSPSAAAGACSPDGSASEDVQRVCANVSISCGLVNYVFGAYQVVAEKLHDER